MDFGNYIVEYRTFSTQTLKIVNYALTVNTCVNRLCNCIVFAVLFQPYSFNSHFNLLTMHMCKMTVCLLHENHLILPVWFVKGWLSPQSCKKRKIEGKKPSWTWAIYFSQWVLLRCFEITLPASCRTCLTKASISLGWPKLVAADFMSLHESPNANDVLHKAVCHSVAECHRCF